MPNIYVPLYHNYLEKCHFTPKHFICTYRVQLKDNKSNLFVFIHKTIQTTKKKKKNLINIYFLPLMYCSFLAITFSAFFLAKKNHSDVLPK